LGVLESLARQGVTFQGKTALVTGCGSGSIGFDLVKCLLRGGARVYATTTRSPSEQSWPFRMLFEQYGGKSRSVRPLPSPSSYGPSELVVLPFNAGSVQDVDALVDHLYDTER